MALIKTLSPEEAEGNVKEAYSFFENMGAAVPLPMQLMSASPELMAAQGHAFQYFMAHPALSLPLLAHIRLLVAQEENYQFCINMNQNLLQTMGGLTEEQVAAAKSDPAKASLDAKDIAMLQFVLKAVKDPAVTEQKDVDGLRDLGWKDSDIYDAVMHGLNMVSAGMAFKTFKMGE